MISSFLVLIQKAGMVWVQHCLLKSILVRYMDKVEVCRARSYALVTKNLTGCYTEECTGIFYQFYGKRSVPLEQIRDNIQELYEVARNNEELNFKVVYQSDSNNLNGYSSNDIFEQFVVDIEIPKNIYFNESFKELSKDLLRSDDIER